MIIEIKSLNHIYSLNTPFESKALDDVSFDIGEGEFIGLIGPTGSGKSTLIQHLNGLLKPSSGKIKVCGIDLTKEKTKLREVRQKVGLVFQYPEHQLFEETIYMDIAFGPKNQGLSEEEIDTRVRDSMELVGLDFLDMKDRSPFDLSGGQMRRVAIAGVLAMKPELLILDEPTAGLDPRGREEILNQIKKIRKKKNITIILVSHSMEDIARLVDKILVMYKGKLAIYDTPLEVFKKVEKLEEFGLGVPQVTYFMKALREKGIDVDTNIFTVDKAKDEILKYLRRNKDA